MTEERSAHRTTFGRSIAGAVLVGLIATIVPLSLATPAFAARAKTISVGDVSIVEGNAGSQNMSFKIAWSGAKGPGAVSVSYATADVTATAGSDYTAKSGVASLTSGGCRCATILVPILGDTMAGEGTETFALNLSNPVNATILDGQAIGTIIDNEGPASLVVLDASTDENTGPLVFTVQMTSSAGTQTVDYSTTDGTAITGSDYMSTSGTLNFTSGITTRTVSVPLNDDAVSETDETFTLTLSNATVAVTDGSAIGTITNDDAEPTISISDASAAENAGPLSFTISLSAASGQEVDVDYTTTDGAASEGSDYTLTSGTAVISAGQTSVQVDVPVTDDGVHESDEGLTLDLSSPYNASITDAEGAGTITNDDALPAASIGDATVTEGNLGLTPATFDVTLDHASDSTVTVDWATADGSATVLTDYLLAGGTVTFAPGVTSQQVSVDAVGDILHEGSETFMVVLSSPTGASIGTGTGTATITDDDRTFTALTLKVRKTATKVSAKGVLETAIPGAQVAVSLLKKKATKWVVVTTRVANVGILGDRDTDGLLDAGYHVGFKRPSKGTYRVRSVFAGTLDLLPCGKTVTFKL
jgi:chitinase